MKEKALLAICVLLMCVVVTKAQYSKPLTNSDIIRMTKEKVDNSIIIRAIGSASEVNFDISPDGLIQLKKGKVKKDIIALIQRVQSAKNVPENVPGRATLKRRPPENTNTETPAPPEPKGVSWSEMPVVKGKVSRRPDTVVFGEKYPDSIYLPEEIAAFRTGQKFKKLIMKIGVQDNENASGRKHILILNENGSVREVDALPNRRPIEIDLDISDYDLVGFKNYDINGESAEFIRYINVTFVPKDK